MLRYLLLLPLIFCINIFSDLSLSSPKIKLNDKDQRIIEFKIENASIKDGDIILNEYKTNNPIEESFIAYTLINDYGNYQTFTIVLDDEYLKDYFSFKILIKENFAKDIFIYLPSKVRHTFNNSKPNKPERISSETAFSLAKSRSEASNKLEQAEKVEPEIQEIEIIKNGARIADIGGEEIVKNITEGNTEIEVAIAGRDKMEREIAKSYPDAEYMDTWVWFQSGINTDGAHNPKTNRALQNGDILSLNTFPMISGYYTALERTLFVNEIDDASLKAWEANVKVHKRGLELIKPGVKCSEICEELNNLFAELGYLQYRTFGYGHSFGMLSHFYGREAGLELREDIDTVLEKNMVISMEPMIMIPEGKPGAGGYREHDILVIKEDGAENITKFPFGPDHNIIKN